MACLSVGLQVWNFILKCNLDLFGPLIPTDDLVPILLAFACFEQLGLWPVCKSKLQYWRMSYTKNKRKNKCLWEKKVALRGLKDYLTLLHFAGTFDSAKFGLVNNSGSSFFFFLWNLKAYFCTWRGKCNVSHYYSWSIFHFYLLVLPFLSYNEWDVTDKWVQGNMNGEK